MAYLIFTEKLEAEKHQVEVDKVAGYPEALESLRYVGVGIHAPKELGRAVHYASVQKHPEKEQWALPVDAKVAKPAKATEVAALPEDWKPKVDFP